MGILLASRNVDERTDVGGRIAAPTSVVVCVVSAILLLSCGGDSTPDPEEPPHFIGVDEAVATIESLLRSDPELLKCPVTVPNGDIPPGEEASPGHFGNGHLWVSLYPLGTVVFGPGWHGDILANGMKFIWWRSPPGTLLEIKGQRLDGSAPPLASWIPSGYENNFVQATSLIFPTEGCWEVTGQAGGFSLTFVTRVIVLGENP